jgi:hypothetical protein
MQFNYSRNTIKNMNNNNLIELNLKKNIYDGYTDNELELLADSKEVNKGIASWVYWTSELYSFGRLFREWAYYPKLLPLFVYSDHGVHKKSTFDSHEINNNANYHFTFNEERVLKNATYKKKRVICVPHPWIIYRRRNNINQLKEAKGTLVFFSHSNDGVEFVGHDTGSYFEELKMLPKQYQPIVVCMHMHDVRKGYHKDIRKHKIPIVTAGNTSSIKFVDEFYNIIKNFKYATSNTPGTQMYYCTEMGIPYFLMGKVPKLINHSSSESPLGEFSAVDPIHLELVEIEKHLFNNRVDSVSLHQKIYVEWILGLNSGVSPLEASWILWREFFRNWPRWYLIFQPIVVWLIRKLGLEERARKYRDRLKENKK